MLTAPIACQGQRSTRIALRIGNGEERMDRSAGNGTSLRDGGIDPGRETGDVDSVAFKWKEPGVRRMYSGMWFRVTLLLDVHCARVDRNYQYELGRKIRGW